MSKPKPFILVSTVDGVMIVNRLDYATYSCGPAQYGNYGVGYDILTGADDDALRDITLMKELLSLRKRTRRGDGREIVALDIGANIGTHTVAFANHMYGWGRVVAAEAQERIFYTLAGNITLNNCLNAQALWAAFSDKVSTMKMPKPNYLEPANFGALSLEKQRDNIFGQHISFEEKNMVEIQTKTIDSLNLESVDLIKIDVEGMELKVLEGGIKTICAQKPFLFIEHIHVDRQKLAYFLEENRYIYKESGMNTIAIHKDDKMAKKINLLVEQKEPLWKKIQRKSWWNKALKKCKLSK